MSGLIIYSFLEALLCSVLSSFAKCVYRVLSTFVGIPYFVDLMERAVVSRGMLNCSYSTRARTDWTQAIAANVVCVVFVRY